MTAADNLSRRQFTPAIAHGQQLPMFMTPNEIGGMLSADYDTHVRDVPERMRSAQEHQARGGPIKMDRIAKEVRDAGGVERPVRVKHIPESGIAALYDGHHRAVAAMGQDKLIPVEHYFDHHAAMHDIHKDNGDRCWQCDDKVPTEYWKG